MSLHWSTTDSSHQREDSTNNTGPSAQKADAGSPQPSSSRAPATLHAICDFDFETLIDLLGTSAPNGRSTADEFALSGVEKSLGDISDLTLDHDASVSVAQGNTSAFHVPTPLPLRKDSGKDAVIQATSRLSFGPMNDMANASRRGRESSGLDESGHPLDLQDAPNLHFHRAQASSSGEAPEVPEAVHPKRSNETRTSKDTYKKSLSKLSRQVTLAVSEAEQQLAELRNHVDILKGDVKILAPRAFERAFDSQPYDAVTSGGSYPPSVRDSAPQSDAAGANPEFVESLSEQQAKVLLQELIVKLKLDLPSSPASGPDVLSVRLEQISRAFRFVSEVDNIVWRASGSTTAAAEHMDGIILGEDNMRALLDRIRLWERTSRSRFARSNRG